MTSEPFNGTKNESITKYNEALLNDLSIAGYDVRTIFILYLIKIIVDIYIFTNLNLYIK